MISVRPGLKFTAEGERGDGLDGEGKAALAGKGEVIDAYLTIAVLGGREHFGFSKEDVSMVDLEADPQSTADHAARREQVGWREEMTAKMKSGFSCMTRLSYLDRFRLLLSGVEQKNVRRTSENSVGRLSYGPKTQSEEEQGEGNQNHNSNAQHARAVAEGLLEVLLHGPIKTWPNYSGLNIPQL
ncbi:hypothetical protein B296_00039363 [Ensete ventricosum]|uniref:Uncharacterized protein n=1 Tax=Ensete ventricosum TaxID=4639 RepID=A0A426ZQN9_ENSVE|nr:hypothetical protein B296_00039363 [Ensete ventricosum]